MKLYYIAAAASLVIIRLLQVTAVSAKKTCGELIIETNIILTLKTGEKMYNDHELTKMAKHLHDYYVEEVRKSARNLAPEERTKYQEGEVIPPGSYPIPKKIEIIREVDLIKLGVLKDQYIEKMTFEHLEPTEVVASGIRYGKKIDAAMLRIAAMSEQRMRRSLSKEPAFQPLRFSHEILGNIALIGWGNTKRSVEIETIRVVELFKNQIEEAADVLDELLRKTQDQKELTRIWTNFKQYNIKFANDLADETFNRFRNIAKTSETEQIPRRLEAELQYLERRGSLIVDRIIEYSFILARQMMRSSDSDSDPFFPGGFHQASELIDATTETCRA